MTSFYIAACQGGFCKRRESCAHYVRPTSTVAPAHRLCSVNDPDEFLSLAQAAAGGMLPGAHEGAVFGRLTLVELAGRDPNGRKVWRCSCDCGGERLAVDKGLVGGAIKSCGCIRSGGLTVETEVKPEYKRQQPAVGVQYGRLKVQEFVGVDKAVRKRKWLCQCECGGTRVVDSGNLIAGNIKSCGCIALERKQQAEAKKAAKVAKAERAKQAKAKPDAAPRETRMSIRPELRYSSPMARKPNAASQAAKSRASASQKPAPKPREQKDLGPWMPRKVQQAVSAPAQRDPRAIECPSPKFHNRVSVDPSEVTPFFSAMRPGQYIDREAA